MGFGATVAQAGPAGGKGTPEAGRGDRVTREASSEGSTCWASEPSREPPAATLQGADPSPGPKLSFAPLGRDEPRLSRSSDFRCECV